MLRKLTVGLAMSATLLAPLAGCDSNDPKTTSAPKPTEVVAAAVSKTAGVSFKLLVVQEPVTDSLSGVYDGTSQFVTFDQTSDGEKTTFTITPDELYLSGISDLKGMTARAKISKIPTTNPIAPFIDPICALSIVPASTDVKGNGPGSYVGTIDLAKVTPASDRAKKFLEAATAGAGAKANAIAFTIAVDANGYMSRFVATFPGLAEGKNLQYEVKFSEFGAAGTVAKPTSSKIIDLPDSWYTEK